MVIKFGLTPKVGSIGSPDRDIMAKPNGRISVRKGGSPEGVSASERYRRMTMAVNHMLTHAIKDRVVQGFQLNASEV